MNEEAKKKLQAIIDHDYELAKEHVAKAQAEGRMSNLDNTFCFFVCFDLVREYGLDLKGVIPE